MYSCPAMLYIHYILRIQYSINLQFKKTNRLEAVVSLALKLPRKFDNSNYCNSSYTAFENVRVAQRVFFIS